MNDLISKMQALAPDDPAALLARCNGRSERFALSLTLDGLARLREHRLETLAAVGRVEFGEGVLYKLVSAFSGSPYIVQADYERTLADLEELFYSFKSECGELLSDDELIEALRLIYDGVAHGSTEYLAGLQRETLCHVGRSGSLAGSGLLRPDFDGGDDE